jgi:hypothetical protein
MPKVKLYVGCALTFAGSRFKKQIQKLKIELKKDPRIKLLEFLGLSDGSDTDVYVHDIKHCVKKADIILGEVSYASIGLGWELGTAIEARHIHALICKRKSKKVSRLITGACKARGNKSRLVFYEYEDILELIPIVKKLVTKVLKQKQALIPYIVPT